MLRQNGVPICCCFERARLRCTDYTSTSLHDARSGMSTWLDHSRESEHDVGFDFSDASSESSFSLYFCSKPRWQFLSRIRRFCDQELRNGKSSRRDLAGGPDGESEHDVAFDFSVTGPGTYHLLIEVSQIGAQEDRDDGVAVMPTPYEVRIEIP
ncbi:unnamed protein product, partial [Mesorhabditis belari]|uniref:Uncharacterized protein n=1 Tax=Mesorhabditis belari TaxID=2138241 RepID=A0AAF3ETS7_9BILA